jgi:hypothetical protein
MPPKGVKIKERKYRTSQMLLLKTIFYFNLLRLYIEQYRK